MSKQPLRIVFAATAVLAAVGIAEAAGRGVPARRFTANVVNQAARGGFLYGGAGRFVSTWRRDLPTLDWTFAYRAMQSPVTAVYVSVGDATTLQPGAGVAGDAIVGYICGGDSGMDCPAADAAFSGTWSVDDVVAFNGDFDDWVQEVRAGNSRVVVVTEANPQGELWGQVRPVRRRPFRYVRGR